jgi:hypothetical protein
MQPAVLKRLSSVRWMCLTDLVGCQVVDLYGRVRLRGAWWRFRAVPTHVVAFVTLAVVRTRVDGRGRTSCWLRSPRFGLLILDDVAPAPATTTLRLCRKEIVSGRLPRAMVVVEAGYVVLVVVAAAMADRSRCLRPVVLAAQCVAS